MKSEQRATSNLNGSMDQSSKEQLEQLKNLILKNNEALNRSLHVDPMPLKTVPPLQIDNDKSHPPDLTHEIPLDNTKVKSSVK
jgi:hypothetical protein